MAVRQGEESFGITRPGKGFLDLNWDVDEGAVVFTVVDPNRVRRDETSVR